METIFPRIMDQLRKDFRATLCEIRDYGANIPPYPYAVDFLFDHVQGQLEKMASGCRLYEPSENPKEMYKGVSDIIPETLSCGEGWLMAAEIAHYAKQGVKTFVILQPFGCLPNHICGRGVIKPLKEEFPGISILPLDLDPDTSYANVENRLQMLIMNSRVPKDDTAEPGDTVGTVKTTETVETKETVKTTETVETNETVKTTETAEQQDSLQIEEKQVMSR